MDLNSEWEEFLFFEDKGNEYCNNNSIKSVEVVNDNNIDIPKGSDIYISTKSQIIFLSQEIDILNIFWNIPCVKYYEQKAGIIMKQIKINCENDNDISDTEIKIKENKDCRVNILTKKNNICNKKKFISTMKITIGFP